MRTKRCPWCGQKCLNPAKNVLITRSFLDNEYPSCPVCHKYYTYVSTINYKFIMVMTTLAILDWLILIVLMALDTFNVIDISSMLFSLITFVMLLIMGIIVVILYCNQALNNSAQRAIEKKSSDVLKNTLDFVYSFKAKVNTANSYYSNRKLKLYFNCCSILDIKFKSKNHALNQPLTVVIDKIKRISKNEYTCSIGFIEDCRYNSSYVDIGLEFELYEEYDAILATGVITELIADNRTETEKRSLNIPNWKNSDYFN